MLIPYTAIAIGTGLAAILGSGFSVGGFIAAPFVGSFCALTTALIFGWFDPDTRAERAMRAELDARRDRDRRILSIFAERAGGSHPITIEGDFSVVADLRKNGAL